MAYFVDVLLPLPLSRNYTYAINTDEAKFIKSGMRIAVPLGKSKIVTGLAVHVHQNEPVYETKEIYQILDNEPLVTAHQLHFWQWIAGYYLCTPGEVMRAALPGILLLESETRLVYKGISLDKSQLTDDEYLLTEAFEMQPGLKLDEIAAILNKKNIMPVVKSLIEKGGIEVDEVIQESYKPKSEAYLSLHPQFDNSEDIHALLDKLQRAERQRETFMAFLAEFQKHKKPVLKKVLLKNATHRQAALHKLIKNNILVENQVQTDRIIFENQPILQPKALNQEQQKALEQIKNVFDEKKVCLLHGVTSSGKTEVYVKLITEALNRGEQVLYLVPEIALTTQLVMRLQAYFGDSVTVYHSKYNSGERVEVWKKVLEQSFKGQIVVGARSAVFLPFKQLGLIVVDEEHETSYKQFEPSPRYNARDAAIFLGTKWGSRVVLGTATPSVESYSNALTGKYRLVELQNRFGDFDAPEIQCIDLRIAYKKKQMSGHFSKTLLQAIGETLDKHKKVILFKNRRGFAPVLECQACGYVPYCPNCDVSLTYHHNNRQLKCHYCSFNETKQNRCTACGSLEILNKGFGTEQVEEELKQLFPKANIGRMDSDTTRGKKSFEKLIKKFEEGEIQILVGTQMISKGLSFSDVGLVGIMQADDLLHHPDFRAHERCFQMLSQVGGRVGRGDLRGRVLIQTFSPEHPVLNYVMEIDYKSLYQSQIEQRKEFAYPPFKKIIKVILKHKNYQKIDQAAKWMAKGLQKIEETVVLGPDTPEIGRIRNEHIKQIILKINSTIEMAQQKKYVFYLKDKLQASSEYRSVKIILDVDAY